MEFNQDWYLDIDQEGRLYLPKELTSSYHLQPDSKVHLKIQPNGVFISSPLRLAKLYIEPTNQCNLDCRTCVRNTWTEPMGKMSMETFDMILKGIQDFSPPPTVFFGGFGEPLLHPEIVNMIIQLKSLGCRVEMITNGMLLTPEMSEKLVQNRLDMLWVSLDGARPESFSNIRLGAAFPQIIENIRYLYSIQYYDAYCWDPLEASAFTQIGVAFVAMKHNINDLPDVVKIAESFGASQIMVTNVLPYTQDMREEVLYKRAADRFGTILLPPIDQDPLTSEALAKLNSINMVIKWSNDTSGNDKGRCPFIEKGSGAVGWRGDFSPCLALMHDYDTYYFDKTRHSRRWVVGNVNENSLADIWYNPEHQAFRHRVQDFDFSPCTSCYSCELFENNEADCIGNTFPTCGGCLWGQGLIQCP
jgi:MoaA/NifB/PqqE/SkfB family radical SAM enzyme